jgi:ubiquinone/menaquinone biosynthesis C-methylase UbiE
MDRKAWLDERRRVTEETFDRDASTYDVEDAPITSTHRRFITRLIEECPKGARILDAPCGTGKYFSTILDAGCFVVGADQSSGMLEVARAKHPEVPTEKVGLQELTFASEFDAAICVDAMENVFPEDWPLVLGNLRRASRSGGYLYLTVETIDEREIAQVFNEATASGLPVVYGEHVGRGGGYHHYPQLTQVDEWVRQAGLRVIEDGRSEGDGYGYYHLLTRSQTEGEPDPYPVRPS